MYQFFNSKNPLLNILFPVLSVLFLMNLPTEKILIPAESEKTFLYNSLISIFKGDSFVFFYKISSALLLAFNAIYFSWIIIKIKLFDIYNNFHGFVFLFLNVFLIWYVDILSLLLSLSFFQIALYILLKTLRKKYALLDIYNVGFLLSIASFFRVEILLFYPFLLIALLILRSVNLREWTILLIGSLTPLFIGISVFYFMSSSFDIIPDTLDLLKIKQKITGINLISIIALSIIALITFLISIRLFFEYRSKEANIQDYLRIFFMLFIFSVLYFLTVQSARFISMNLAIIAFSIPISIFFKRIKRKLLRELLFDIFLISLISVHIEFFRNLNF